MKNIKELEQELRKIEGIELIDIKNVLNILKGKNRQSNYK